MGNVGSYGLCPDHDEKTHEGYEMTSKQFLFKMTLIRKFEEKVQELFYKGMLSGTTHLYIGQEANAVAISAYLCSEDVVVSNHRSHGHYLARTDDVEGLMAELLGLSSGVCGGKGGSQHICKDNFFSNGILGGMAPFSAGYSLKLKADNSGKVVVAFIGDGTWGEGVVYETLNIASLWRLPLFIVAENNFYAQSTPIALAMAGDIGGRAKAFGIPFACVESTDVEEIYEAAQEPFNHVRSGNGPFILQINTYRLVPHSKGDEIRSKEEVDEKRRYDPLTIHGRRFSKQVCQTVLEECLQRIEDTIERLSVTGTE
jgi:TPP-dependent pyruvate/acetoin dehydrogenase alpha subunit